MNGHETNRNSVQATLPQTYKAIMKYVKSIKELLAQGLSYHLAMGEDSSPAIVAELNKRILAISNRVLKFQGLSEHQAFGSVEHVFERYVPLIDLFDSVYEKVDDQLHQLLKNIPELTSNAKPLEGPEAVLTHLGIHENGTDSKYSMILSRNQHRPQNYFPEKVDNGYNTPFVSRLFRVGIKPNSLKPLSQDLVKKFQGVSLDQITLDMAANLPHPYKFELENLEYSDFCFIQTEPALPKNLDDTPLTMVSDPFSLKTMIENLKTQTIISIDLEAHDYRSYYGFVCLMQISTFDEDYIVDTLVLRNELIELNEVFTDPKIIKVFHGADNDINWLQRDFGVYVVNMFDTYQACKTLALPKGSLAFLLDYYLKITADKQYQLADWRTRPLPKEMVDYARSDTHYLLYIFERMRNQLIEESTTKDHNKVRAVLDMSQHVASQIYTKPLYDPINGDGPGGWAKLLENFTLPLSPQQVETFRQLHAWRDMKAREEDESVRYILPNHMLFNLAFKMPTTTAGVLGCCEPLPLAVRMGAHDLAQLIADIPIGGGGVIAPLDRKFQKTPSKTSLETKNCGDWKEIVDESRKIDLPVASNFKGKSTIEDVMPILTKSHDLTSSNSNFFGALFFDCNNTGCDPSQFIIRSALRDQILANMDFCPIPSTIQIEAQVEDTRIDPALQKVSESAAPEGHDYNMEKASAKDSVVILSGKSKYGTRPLDVEEVVANAATMTTISNKKSKKSHNANTPAIVDHNYEDSKATVDRLLSANAGEKKKTKKKPDSQSEAPEEPFDPFGKDMEGSFSMQSTSGYQKNSSNKGNHHGKK